MGGHCVLYSFERSIINTSIVPAGINAVLVDDLVVVVYQAVVPAGHADHDRSSPNPPAFHVHGIPLFRRIWICKAVQGRRN